MRMEIGGDKKKRMKTKMLVLVGIAICTILLTSPTLASAGYSKIYGNANEDDVLDIEKSWIDENKINEETISLNRYNGGWIRLPTEKIGEDGEFITFRAMTDGFSYFAITGERGVAEEQPTPGTGRSDTGIQVPASPDSSRTKPEQLSWSYVLLAVIGTVLVCGAIFLAISRR